MSALFFLVVSLAGAVLVGTLRSHHLGLAPSEHRSPRAHDTLPLPVAAPQAYRPTLSAHAGHGRMLVDPSAA